MRRDATAETDKTANYGQGRATEWSRDTEAPRKPRVHNPLSDEFDRTSRAASTLQLPAKFASPPLMEGFLTSVVDVLGPRAQPTPIQALSLKHLFKRPLPDSSAPLSEEDVEYVQCLLASETGSGKSIAYLLPMLQDLKISEMQSDPASLPPSQFALAPRALVLAPTHELSRQLSGFAKALLHEVKLRVLCVSQANNPSTPARTVSASKMSKEMDFDELVLQEGTQRKITRPVDVVVGTPSKILELVKGRSWDREQPNIEDTWDKNAPKPRAFTVGKPEMGLDRIEWVVVDEADVLFGASLITLWTAGCAWLTTITLDPDFQEHTKMILSAIAEARGQAPEQLDEAALSKVGPENPAPINYPFNLLLSTATIPSALAWYLDTYHPALLRLASPHLHHLPKSLKTVYVAWSGGNRNADVERQLRYVWQEDVLRDTGDKSSGGKSNGGKSKVLIFCNRSTKVEDLGRHLEAKGIANVALTSTSEARKWGSNHHLDGFLKDKTRHVEEAPAAASDGEASTLAAPAPGPRPRRT
ncbi:hypothetical protein EVJ58_g7524 [Rhodofomes roseus]|uniref:RNA helicase n=1 Tax=Rhodofomes roseus TaxID=34475 RepID=A0A4Y9Y3W9_9APHY|nr:hypothetical protein EVJ58_g7524 [Rhodofomes roseus]